MLATTETAELVELHKALQGSGRAYFVSRYPALVAWYDEHIATSEVTCPLVLASLKAIRQQEIESNDESLWNHLATESR